MKRSCLILALLFAITTAGWANMLTNSSFEYPTNTGSWANTGWINDHGERNNWYPRQGALSGMFWSWDDNASGYVYQDVPVTTGGTFIAGMWIRLETNLPWANTNRMTLEWYNSSTSSVAPSATATYPAVPPDGKWHHVHVKGTCTSSSLAIVRVRMDASWGVSASSDQVAYYFDNAELVRDMANTLIGSETPVWNGSFTEGSTDWWQTFRASQWEYSYVGYEEGCRLELGWTGRDGQYGVVALEGYQTNQLSYSVEVFQRAIPLALGTNTFAFWADRESGFLLTNFQARIEWYDNTFTNKIQADSVQDLTTITNDGQYRQYSVTGVCTNPALNEARLVLFAQFNSNPDTNIAGRSMIIDDVRFLPGSFSDLTNAMITDWCYHNSMGYNARNEQVPGTNVGSFLQVDYGSTSVTIYVLADSPSQAKYYPLEQNTWEMRTSWWDPGSGSWTDNWSTMTWMGDVTISSATPFHNLPESGSKTASLWKLVWPMPKDISGVPYTNHLLVYYSPFTKTTNGSQETSYNYLLCWNTSLTNNLDQQLGKTPQDHDYLFDLNPDVVPAFTNGGFEYPVPATNNLDNSHWTGIGGASRQHFASRLDTNGWGAYFPSWDPNHSILWQDVSVTGGMYVFSSWVQIQTGATPANASMSMQWFDKNGRLVQENKKDLLSSIPRGSWWNRVYVMAACSETNLDHVRLSFEGFYEDAYGSYVDGFMFDDVAFDPIQAYGLVNTGFETGIDADLVDWYGCGTFGHIWSAPWPHSGSALAIFQGWEQTQPQYESFLAQPMQCTTGSYVLSVWVRREADFAMTNAELKIEWYDGTLTNKVQADTVATLTVPNDASYYFYAVTGVCNDVSVRAMVPGLFVQWDRSAGADRSMGADDFSLTLIGDTSTDGIPNSWWEQYAVAAEDRVALGDLDDDGYLNIEEYAGDTVPTNNESHFSEITTSSTSNRMVINLVVDPSSTGRVYDAYWKTNLMEAGAWQNYGLSVTGNGAAITLTVTNKLDKQFYRTGAQLP